MRRGAVKPMITRKRFYIRTAAWLLALSGVVAGVTAMVGQNSQRAVFLEAAKQGDWAYVLAHLPKDRADLDRAFLAAAHYGNAETVEALLAHGADVNTRGDDGVTALMIAGADGGHTAAEREAIWRVLLRHHPDVRLRDRYGMTALHWAALFDDAPLCRQLLARNADIHARQRNGNTPLVVAERGKDPVLIKLFRRPGS